MPSTSFSHRNGDHSKTFRSAIVIVLVIGLCTSSCFGDTLQRDAELIVAGIGLAGAAVATGIFFAIHHSHTSLSGCVVQTADTSSVRTGSGKTYELLNAPPQVKPDEHLSFRGHRVKTTSGHPAFWIDHVSGDHGPCKATGS